VFRPDDFDRGLRVCDGAISFVAQIRLRAILDLRFASLGTGLRTMTKLLG